MIRKYNIEKINGEKRIIAVRSFDGVKVGDIGGIVSSEYNLSHDGTCWIDYDSKAQNRSKVDGDAKLHSSVIKNYAKVSGNAKVIGSTIAGSAIIYGNSVVSKGCEIKEHAEVSDSKVTHSFMRDSSSVSKSVIIDSTLSHSAKINDSVVKKSSLDADVEIANGKVTDKHVTIYDK